MRTLEQSQALIRRGMVLSCHVMIDLAFVYSNGPLGSKSSPTLRESIFHMAS